MNWRVAKSLLALRKQVNEKFPGRKKDWDGTIGDANHSARASDHNPDDNGVVKAMDITHDPKGGVDSYAMAEQLRISRDHRIKYIISNGRICSSIVDPWKWRTYSGKNKHDHHIHISVLPERRHYDDEAPWEIPMLGKVPSVPFVDIPPPPDIPIPEPKPKPLSFWERFNKWLNSLGD